MYRPEGWEKVKQGMCVHCQGIPEAGIKPETCDTCPTEPMVCNTKAEALVDAMLEALMESDEPSCEVFETTVKGMDGKESGPVRAYGKQYPGKWAFIPEEE